MSKREATGLPEALSGEAEGDPEVFVITEGGKVGRGTWDAGRGCGRVSGSRRTRR